MPINKSIEINISDEDLAFVKMLAKAQKESYNHVQRAKILFFKHKGYNNSQIAREVNVVRETVRNILKKYNKYGIDGAIYDLPRAGRGNIYTEEHKAIVIWVACQLPENLGYLGAPQTQTWTFTTLTQTVHEYARRNHIEALKKISPASVWRILNEADIKPTKFSYYLKRKGGDFFHAAADVLLFYKRIKWFFHFYEQYVDKCYLLGVIPWPIHKFCEEVFISYDEKPGIQALGRVAEDLPASPCHKHVGRDYEYKRYGTVTMMTGMDLMTGEIINKTCEKHDSEKFIKFLEDLDEKYDKKYTINILLDNHSIHCSGKTKEYLASLPGRFVFIFTPVHASWLNLVESFFSKITRLLLKNLRVKSKKDLINRIENFINFVNDNPVIYDWTWKLDDIESFRNTPFAKLRRASEAIKKAI